MISEESKESDSSLIHDERLNVLFNWVLEHGGKVSCESREDNLTKVRGLYASHDLIDETEPVVQIPSKLIVSPYHIAGRMLSESSSDGEKFKITYEEVFKLNPKLFDSTFPYEPSQIIP